MSISKSRLAGVRQQVAGLVPELDTNYPHFVLTAPKGVRPPLVDLLARRNESLTVVVTASGRDAEVLEAQLGNYTDGVAVFPSWETLPHEQLSPRSDTMAKRAQVLRRLLHPIQGDPHTPPVKILLLPVRALLQPLTKSLAEVEPVVVHEGDSVSPAALVARLLELGYTRTDLVERRGEVAVRGGLVDVFPPTESHPLRLEFFGDDVDEIRTFAVSDQRTIEKAASGLWAPPCRELLLTESVRERAASLQNSLPGFAEMLERLSQGTATEGMEVLMPVLKDDMTPLAKLLPEDALFIADDPERIEARSTDLLKMTAEFMEAAWSSAAAGGKVPFSVRELPFENIEDTKELILQRGMRWWELTSLRASGDDGIPTAEVAATEPAAYRGDARKLGKDLKEWITSGWQVVCATPGAGGAARLQARLAEIQIPARMVEQIDAEPFTEPVVRVIPAAVQNGFVSEKAHFVLLSEADITGKSRANVGVKNKVPARRKKGVDPLALQAGDYIVHEQHGVGRFIELATRTMGRGKDQVTREYLVVEYAPSKKGRPTDRLWVPTDSLDLVSKYTGGETPQLSKMGGSDWAKTKAKARKATRKIAAELIRLYAARQATKGHAFAPDTPWQHQLEDSFEYVETPDQLTVIDEIKADMEKPAPMDRLLSGDVGYGKTEIAIRAAFKAVQDSKQVAVLVPTTLLVQQHFETFSERYAGFPVKVAALSRFTSKKEAEHIKDDLLAGKIDVVIGTHSLVTGQVRFKDLGLVIIDEEQRFGVEHKETLKQLRTNVDVLSMSATPIPRTLEMAVTGIREMSTLATPPEERHPVLTYVGRYTNSQVKAAIRREMLRDGQTFFVHNRVDSISKVAADIAELVPEARVGIAHGKMSESQLESVIMDFWNRDLDVLVCTTIVETGLDISNANTLIVDRADRMGLSQLHQLRVGRGRERAYAYFLYPGDKPLTETAHQRLSTIAANTDLGAGTAVAMKDLEIRGAGNLLGGEQSGHIAGIGFDLYVRMVSEAVAEFRGEESAPKEEVKIEVPIDAHVPEDYVQGERLRMEIYAKLASAQNAEERQSVRAELEDRYGPLPAPVLRLFAVAQLREKARQAGVSDIAMQGKYVRFAPVELADSQMMRLRRIHPGTVMKPAVRQVLVPAPTDGKIGGSKIVGLQLLEWIEQVLVLVSTKVSTLNADPNTGAKD